MAPLAVTAAVGALAALSVGASAFTSCCTPGKFGSPGGDFFSPLTAYGVANSEAEDTFGRMDGYMGVSTASNMAITVLGSDYYADAPLGWFT
jgi:hypothetical protein